MKVIEEWSARSKIDLNKEKFMILTIRVDKRTPPPRERTFHGIPLVDEAKYLGLYIDDTGDLRAAAKDFTQRLYTFKRQIKLSWA